METPSQIENSHNLGLTILKSGLALTAGIVLSNFAFTKEIREVIRHRDRDCQWGEEDMHLGNLHCAHINHDKFYEKYNDPENGRLLCEKHHYLDHVNREGRNGLSMEHNKMAKEGLMHSLLKFLGGRRRF